MGERQTLLKSITEDIYSGSLIKSPKLSIFEIEYSGLINEVKRVYSALGGTSEQIPINYGSWDISLKDFFDDENNLLSNDPLITRIYRLNTAQREALLTFLNTID